MKKKNKRKGPLVSRCVRHTSLSTEPFLEKFLTQFLSLAPERSSWPAWPVGDLPLSDHSDWLRNGHLKWAGPIGYSPGLFLKSLGTRCPLSSGITVLDGVTIPELP